MANFCALLIVSFESDIKTASATTDAVWWPERKEAGQSTDIRQLVVQPLFAGSRCPNRNTQVVIYSIRFVYAMSNPTRMYLLVVNSLAFSTLYG